MNVINKIIQCEMEYIKCFCEAEEQEGFIRFKDDLIPDMWYQNYTWINTVKDDAGLIQLIESEISNSKKTGRDFCMLRCHIPVNHTVLSRLSCKPEVSAAGWYVFDAAFLSKMTQAKDSSVIKIDKDEMIDDLLTLDLKHDEESLGRDFCIRRIYRRKDIYLSNEGVDSFICYYKGIPVGSCDLFIHNGAAKIEDFAILPNHQRKGFGTTLIKTLIEIALKKDATVIYVEADEDDTAKEMYKKCGFNKVNEFTDLSFSF